MSRTRARVRGLRIVLGLAAVLAGCGAQQGPLADDEFREMRADNVSTGVRYYVTANGVRQAVLLADTTYTYEDDARLELSGVHLTFFDEEGGEAAVLTSDEGELDTRTNAMVARGSVVIVTHEDGARTETDELHFRPEEDRIWSDTPTTRIVDGATLRGTGFSADGRLNNLQLRQPRGQAPGVRIDF